MMPPGNSDVLIEALGKTYRFRAVSQIEVEYETEVTELTLESGELVSEHAEQARPSLEMTLVCYNPPGNRAEGEEADRYAMLARLYSWWSDFTMLKVNCDIGTFESCIITNLSVQESSKSANTFEVDLSIKTLEFITAEPVEFQYIKDVDGKSINVLDKDGTGIQVTLDVPAKKKHKEEDWWDSAYEKIFGWWD